VRKRRREKGFFKFRKEDRGIRGSATEILEVCQKKRFCYLRDNNIKPRGRGWGEDKGVRNKCWTFSN